MNIPLTTETTQTTTIEKALQIAQNYLSNFASSADFNAKMQLAFGNHKIWEKADLIDFPTIEIRPAAEINNARGAFATATNTIYLSQELVDESRGNVGAITSVLLEEYGHYIDAQNNAIDSPGDEGELFADLVLGKGLSESELLGLWSEDDSAIVVWDGEGVSLEQANTRVQSDELNFFSTEVKNFGGLPDKLEYKLFENELKSAAEKIDTPVFSFLKELNGKLKGSIFFSPGELGNLKFSYPLNMDVKLPDALDSDEIFPIILGLNYKLNDGNFKDSSGFDSPNAGIKFEYQSQTTKISDIEIKNPFGDPFKLEGLNLSDPFKAEVGYDVATFVKDLGKVKLPGGLGEISVSLPKIRKEDIKTVSPADSNGKFPSLAATGKTPADQRILNLQLDVDKALSIPFPALKALGNEIEFPNAQKEEGEAKKAQENLQIQLDVLRTIPNEAGQQLALQEAEKLRQEAESARLNSEAAKDNAQKTRLKTKLSYDILDIKANVGLGLQQDFTLVPDDIKVTVSVDEGSVNGLKEITQSFGEPFDIKAPSTGSGVMTVKAKYELSGQVENNLGFILQGSVDVSAIQFGAKISLGNAKVAEAKVGPLLSLQLPNGGFSSEPFPFIGTNPKDQSLFNPLYVQISPKKLNEIGGIEQDDNNPQAEATKNLIIEKEYKIPYNLPISISDVQATEGENLVFTVSRRDLSNEPFTLIVEYENQTADSGDYLAGQTIVTLPAGQASADIIVPTTQDNQKEGTESFKVKLKKADGSSFATNAPVNTIDAIGTIIDDDDEDKPKPPQPEIRFPDTGDPHLVTFDGLHYDFQSVGEFILVKSTTGDLEIQVRQQPFNNSSSVSMNTAVATKIDGQRVAFYGGEKTPLLVDGKPTDIPDNSSISVGSGGIYRKGNTYTVILNKAGEQLVVDTSESNPLLDVNTYLAQGREGQVVGLGGNNNGKTDDDIALRDGTVLSQPITPQVLYGKYEDSWRISQAESFFDYKPGQNTETFTNRYFPSEYVTIDDLDPADRQKAEQMALAAGITDPTILQSAIIDLVLSNFDESFLQSALRSKTPESSLIIRVEPQAKADFTSTFANTPVKINPLSNDIVTTGIPLSLTGYDQTTAKGGTIQLDNNGTPDDKTDDQLIYTPPTNFVGVDTINYTIADDQKTATGTITVTVPAINLTDLNGNNGFAVTGAAGNFAGSSVSNIGDFNGDGIDDFIVGGFAADPNNINATGESYVIFGTNQGFPANFDLSTLNGTNGFIIEGFEAESFSGGAVSSAGDLNGDGLKDLIIGAFASNSNSLNDSGRTYVVFGSNQPFSTRFNLANLNGSNGFVINSNQPLDYSGLAVSSAGDFNADGLDDLAVAAPAGIDTFLGKVYLVYGRRTSFPPAFNPTDLQYENGTVINHNNGLAGTTVSNAGDINGDRIDDLIIGAEQGLIEGSPKSGETYILFGKDGGYPNGFSLSNLNGSNGFVIKGDGYSVSSVSGAGDINADGLEDILIGVSQSQGNNQPNAGKAYVVFGSKAGYPQEFNLFSLDGKNGFVINGVEPDELLGGSVKSAGDLNGDKIDDIIIGASGATANGIKSAGKTYVIWGTNKGFPASLNSSNLNGENGFFINGTAENELSGVAVSNAGDINKDNVNDILIGAPGSLFDNTAGKGYVVFGHSTFGNQPVI